MLRNIIWDVDGTLFDTYPPINSSIRKALNHLEVDIPIDRIRELTRISLGYCISTLSTEYKLKEEEIRRVFKSFYSKVSAEECPPFAGIQELCNYVLKNGGKNVIVTHRSKAGTDELLSAHGMEDLFGGCITSDNDFPRKPDPAAFLAALEQYNLKKRETITVGDRAIDIQAGQAAGLFSVLYGSQPEDIAPDLVIQEYSDLFQFICNQNEKYPCESE
jgi:HAD superfamily hydrolase (TIGR01509 family)